MKIFKKFLAVILCIAMCCTFMAAPLSAETTSVYYELSLDQPNYAYISRNGVETFNFTPSVDGEYSFYSVGDLNSYAVLYDSDMNEITYNDDASTSDVNFKIDYTLTAGTTYYLEVSMSSRNDTGTITFYVTRLDAEQYAETIEVMGGTELIGYPGTEAYIHVYLSPDGCIDEDVEWTLAENSIAEFTDTDPRMAGLQFSGLGKTTLTASVPSGASTDINITVIDFPVYTIGETVEGEITRPYNNTYYQFTPETDGTYIFNLESEFQITHNIYYNESGVFDPFSNVCLIGDLAYSVSEELELSAGVTYYLGVFSETGDLGAYSFSITQPAYMSSPEIELGTTSVSVAVDESKVYKFIPDETAEYRFYSTSDEDTYISLYDSSYDELAYNDDGGEGNDFLLVYSLEAGKAYYIEVYEYGKNEAITFDVTIEKVEPLTGIIIVDADGNEVSEITDYVGSSYSLGAKPDPQTSKLGSVTWTSSNPEVADIAEGYQSLIELYSAGTATITATDESGVSDTVTITVKDIPVINLDETVSGKLTTAENKAQYRFTPAETGYYRLSATSGDESYKALRITGRSGYGFNTEVSYTEKLNAGTAYTVEVEFDDEDYSGTDYTLTIEYIPTASSISITDMNGVTLSKIVGFEGGNTSLYYSLSPEGSYNEWVSWTSSDESVATVSDGYVFFKGAGSATITVKTSETGISQSIEVGVVAVPSLTLNTAQTITSTATEPGKLETEYLFKFVPETDGVYGIVADSDVDYYTSTYLCDVNGKWLDEQNAYGDYVLQAEMTAGETYYIRTAFNSGYSEEARTYTLTPIKLDKATSITITEGNISGYKNTYDSLTAVFGTEPCAKENVTWTSSDEDIVSVNYTSGSYSQRVNLHFIGVGTATITATSANGLEASVTVTVTEMPALELGAMTTVSIKNGEYAYYGITVQESGYYAVYVNGDSYYGCKLYGGESFLANSYGSNFSLQYNLTAGEEYYISTYISSDSEESTYTVQLVKLEVPTSVSFRDGDCYSAYVDSYKYFYTDYNPVGAYEDAYDVTCSDPEAVNIEYYSNYDKFYCYFNKVGTYTLTVTTREFGLTDTITVTVTEPPVLELDKTVSSTITDAEIDDVYQFTPTEDGYYEVNIVTDESKQIMLDVTNQGGWSGTGEINAKYKLEAGTNYKFDVYLFNQIYNSEEDYYQNQHITGDYTITVSKIPAPERIYFNSSSYSGFVGTYDWVYVSYEPEDCYQESITYSSSDESVVRFPYSGSNYMEFVGEGTATITATIASGLTATATVTVVGYPTLTLNETVSGNFYNTDRTIYKFTPEKDGLYGAVINTSAYSNITAEIYYEVYNEEEDYTSTEWVTYDYGTSFNTQYQMTAGTTYYIRVMCSGGIEYTITAKEITTPAESIYFNCADPASHFVGDRYNYSSNVKFSPSECIKESFTLSSSDESVAKVEYNTVSYVGAGTAVITVTSKNGLTDTFSVTVKAPTQVEIGKEYSGSVTSSNKDAYVFIPETTGWYGFDFSTSENLYVSMEAYDDNGDWWSGNSWYDSSVEIRDMFIEGYTYKFEVSPNGWASADYTLDSDVLTEATGITIENGNIEAIIGSSYWLEAALTPNFSINEEIYWSSSDSSKVTVTGEGYIELVGIGSATITAYTITQTEEGTETRLSTSITVTVKEIPEIKTGTTSITVPSGSNVRYKFIPAKSGAYQFASSGNYDPAVRLYNADMKYLTGADDDSDRNFILNYSFTAGETYYLEFRAYGSTDASFDVTVKKVIELTGLEIVSYPDRMDYYAGVGDNYNLSGLEVKLSLEDGSEAYWKYGDSSLVGDYSVSWSTTYDEETEEYSHVVISCSGLTAEFDFNIIENPVESIELVWGNTPVITENTEGYYSYDGGYYEYYIGSWEDELKFRVNYTDGSFAIVSMHDYLDGYYVEAYSDQYNSHWTVGGDNYFYVRYCGAEAKVPVTIVESDVKLVTLISAPDKIYVWGDSEYGYTYEGETGECYEFYPSDLIGLSFKVTYTDGSTEIITVNTEEEASALYDYCSLENDFVCSKIGTYTVILTYKGASLEYDVELTENNIKSVKLAKSPDSMTYYKGYKPDITGLKLEITYTDGTTETVTADKTNVYSYESGGDFWRFRIKTEDGSYIWINPDDESENGVYIAEYMGISAEIGELAFEYKNEYKISKVEIVNLSADPDELEIKVTYTDGTSQNYKGNINIGHREDKYYFSGTMWDKYGCTNISLENYYDDYGCLERAYLSVYDEEVTTEVNVVIEDVEIAYSPNDTVYTEGTMPELDGLVLKVTYSDGSEVYIESGYTVTGYNKNTVGEQTLTITYADVSTELTVTVEEYDNPFDDTQGGGYKKPGDVNGDEEITADDLVELKKILLGIADENTAADVNDDGVVDVLDFIRLKKNLSKYAEEADNDINGDGSADEDDLIYIQNIIYGIAEADDKADLNGDGVVDILDYIKLKKYIDGKEAEDTAAPETDGDAVTGVSVA